MIEAYLKHEAERKAQGIPPKPLDPEQTRELVKLLESPPKGQEAFLLGLLRESRVARRRSGRRGEGRVPRRRRAGREEDGAHLPKEAIQLLGTMMGGYNVPPLVAALSVPALAEDAAKALAGMTYVYGALDEVVALAKKNAAAKKVVESWAKAEWFTNRPGVPAQIKVKVFKVDGEINTDDFSPAGDASTRPDIPLHALAMGKTRFPGGLAKIAEFRAQGFQVAFVGDVVGTGSSRKSACNSVQWAIGEDIPFVPNKKRGGVIIGGVIAPIFFATAQDSGALPIRADVTKLKTGDVVVVDTTKGEIRSEAGEVLSTFKLAPNTLADEYRAGGRIPLTIGRAVTEKARKAQGLPPDGPLRDGDEPAAEAGPGLLARAEDGRQGLRHPGRAPRRLLRAEDDDGRLAGHHRPDDGGRAEGARLPQVPGADVHAVVLPHGGLPEGGRREDAPHAPAVRAGARRRAAPAGRRRHPLVAEPSPPPGHGRNGRRLAHALPARHLLPGGLRPRRLRGRARVHAPRHAGVGARPLQGQAQPGHHAA